MVERKIEDIITEELLSDDQRVAHDFVDYLKNLDLQLIRDNGYWKDKIYFHVKFHSEYVCFIAIQDPDETNNRWTVWSDGLDSDWLEKSAISNELKEIAWKHIDFCGSCGSCGGGKRKIIFGKEFENVCGCTFRIDNPDAEDLAFMKKMVDIRMQEILSQNALICEK